MEPSQQRAPETAGKTGRAAWLNATVVGAGVTSALGDFCYETTTVILPPPATTDSYDILPVVWRYTPAQPHPVSAPQITIDPNLVRDLNLDCTALGIDCAVHAPVRWWMTSDDRPTDERQN